MASAYPAALDTFAPDHVAEELILSADINDLTDAIVKIETELGINPSGGATDVTGLFAYIETLISNVAINATKIPKHSLAAETDLTFEAAKWDVSDLGGRFASGAATSRTLQVPQDTNTCWGGADLTDRFFIVQQTSSGAMIVTGEVAGMFQTTLNAAAVSSVQIAHRNGTAEFIHNGTNLWIVSGDIELP